VAASRRRRGRRRPKHNKIPESFLAFLVGRSSILASFSMAWSMCLDTSLWLGRALKVFTPTPPSLLLCVVWPLQISLTKKDLLASLKQPNIPTFLNQPNWATQISLLSFTIYIYHFNTIVLRAWRARNFCFWFCFKNIIYFKKY